MSPRSLRSKFPRHGAALLLVLSTLAAASPPGGTPGASEARSNKGHGYRPEPVPQGYFEQTTPLLGLRRGADTEEGAVFFSLTGGNLPGQEPEPYNYRPTLLVRLPEGWQVVDLGKSFLRHRWIHAAVAPTKGCYWGLLEFAAAGPGWEIAVLLSVDGGRSWSHVASLKKPDYEATLESFEMDIRGQGRLRLVSTKESAPGTRRIYTYKTSDWGRTWRKSASVEVSVLVDASPSPEGSACGAAVQRLPEPLPQECRFPESVQRAVLP